MYRETVVDLAPQLTGEESDAQRGRVSSPSCTADKWQTCYLDPGWSNSLHPNVLLPTPSNFWELHISQA